MSLPLALSLSPYIYIYIHACISECNHMHIYIHINTYVQLPGARRRSVINLDYVVELQHSSEIGVREMQSICTE